MLTKPKTAHVMLDLETLATTPDAAVVSMGAALFSPEAVGDGVTCYANHFECTLNLEEQLGRLGRRASGDTVRWWMQQGGEARSVFVSQAQVLAAVALVGFFQWLPAGPLGFCLWSNGADFDIPIILHLAQQLGLTPPWKFYRHRCFRTLKEVHPKLYALANKKFTNPTKHDALADAVWQAQVAVHILRKVR